jgi:hypothetical protein
LAGKSLNNFFGVVRIKSPVTPSFPPHIVTLFALESHKMGDVTDTEVDIDDNNVCTPYIYLYTFVYQVRMCTNIDHMG